ncbi:MAG: hypothetical protein ACE5EY_05260, partial [Anaerolineae bacterium]
LTKSSGLFKAGMIVTTGAGIGFALMTMIFSGWAAILGAVTLIVTGSALLLNNLRQQDAYLPKEKSPKEKLADSLCQ